LQRAGPDPGREGRVGRRGDGTRLIRGPERIGVQALAKALMPGDGGLDQVAGAHLPLTQIARDLDQGTGERIAWHDQLLSNTLDGALPGEGDALDLDA